MQQLEIHKINLQTVDSTNDYAAQLPVPGENEIVVVTAKAQTKGRGQGGNSWESEVGSNALLSIMCSPVFVSPARQFSLLQTAALAVFDVVDETIAGASIKWPNDIYIGQRKVSGTLIECEIGNGIITRAILGIGVNVNQRTFRSDAPNPTSLAIETKRDLNTDSIIDSIIVRFVKRYAMLREHCDPGIAYGEVLFRRTGCHCYRDAGGDFIATLVKVEPDGTLVLRDTDGNERRYAFKEVAFVI